MLGRMKLKSLLSSVRRPAPLTNPRLRNYSRASDVMRHPARKSQLRRSARRSSTLDAGREADIAPGHRHPRAQPPRDGTLLAFSAFALVPLGIAFNEGGLDLVVRQQVGIALAWGLALAGAFGLLRTARVGTAGRWALLGMALLAGWTALSLAWSGSAERTLAEVARVLLYGMVVLTVVLTVGRRTWRAAAAGLCVALLALPVISVLSRVAPEAFDAGPLGQVDRLSYPLGYWNALAAWSAMAIAAGLSLSAQLRSPSLRAACLAPVPIAGLALYLTFSRGGVVAAAVGLATGLVLARHRLTFAIHALAAASACVGLVLVARSNPAILDATEDALWWPLFAALPVAASLVAWVATRTQQTGMDRRRVPARAGIALGGVLLVLGLAGAALAGRDAASTAAEQLTSDAYPSQEGDPAARLTSLEGARDELWASSVRAFASAPFTGLGAGTFEFWWTQDVPGGEALREPHSLYLGQLAELGSPGLAATLLALGGLVAAALGAVASARAGTSVALLSALTCGLIVYLTQAAVDWLWESTALTILVMSGAAVAVVASGARERRPRHRLRGWSLVAVLAGAVVAGAVMVPGVVSTERVRASFASLVIGRAGESERIASDAVAAQPWAASPYAARALARTSQGRLAAASADARRAIAREPGNWRHPLLLAGIQAVSGNADAAERALRDAQDLRPGRQLDGAGLLRGTGEGASRAP